MSRFLLLLATDAWLLHWTPWFILRWLWLAKGLDPWFPQSRLSSFKSLRKSTNIFIRSVVDTEFSLGGLWLLSCFLINFFGTTFRAGRLLFFLVGLKVLSCSKCSGSSEKESFWLTRLLNRLLFENKYSKWQNYRICAHISSPTRSIVLFSFSLLWFIFFGVLTAIYRKNF